jgi:formate dehydrogenase subunit delta
MQRTALVRMVNQIADYFELYPKSEALDGIAKHIHNTWDRRMRNELKLILDAGAEGMNPLSAEAMRYYFEGPQSEGRKAKVNPRKKAPGGASPSFADGGGDAG